MHFHPEIATNARSPDLQYKLQVGNVGVGKTEMFQNRRLQKGLASRPSRQIYSDTHRSFKNIDE